METSNATEHHRLRVFFTGEKQGQDLLAVKDQEMDICKLWHINGSQLLQYHQQQIVHKRMQITSSFTNQMTAFELDF